MTPTRKSAAGLIRDRRRSLHTPVRPLPHQRGGAVSDRRSSAAWIGWFRDWSGRGFQRVSKARFDLPAFFMTSLPASLNDLIKRRR